MKWKKYTIMTKTDAVDMISAVLNDIGIEGIEIEDFVPLTDEETKGMFIDILPELPKDDGKAKVSFYLEDGMDNEEILNTVNEELMELNVFSDIGSCIIIEDETEDKDWINNWKQYFKPFKIEDIVIKPTWEKIPENMRYKTMVEIDPGTAFGTGAHETTKLCIKLLRKYIAELKKKSAKSENAHKGKISMPKSSFLPGIKKNKNINNKKSDTCIKVLDVGTGSGILGITALKLGADEVMAVDVDDNVKECVYQNMKANDIDNNSMKLICGNILEDKKVQEDIGENCYDIVVANILAPVIILLQKEIVSHLKDGALFIASGIIDTKTKEVKSAVEKNPYLELIEVVRDGEWSAVCAKRTLRQA